MAISAGTPARLEWQALPRGAQWFVVAVVLGGVAAVIAFIPRTPPSFLPFVALLVASCVTSIWKVNLPIPLASGSTLSMSYAANLTALLLLGPHEALTIAVAGAWTQCTVHAKRSYPLYRTVFSVAAEAMTMAATGLAYGALGGTVRPVAYDAIAGPLVGAIAVYFMVNTSLVAAAIALSTRQSLFTIWREDFLWSSASFIVAGSAGAGAAVVIARGQLWIAFLTLMPVYLVYRTYSLFVGRLDDERRHVEETRRLHDKAVSALMHAQQSEQALAAENERLSVMLRSIGDGVIATDLNGTILLINQAAEGLTGWPDGSAVGQPLAAVFQSTDPDTRKRCSTAIPVLLASADAAGARRSSVLIARDLTERPIEECAAPFRDVEGRTIGMMLAFRDISDALRVQEERGRAGRLASLGLLAGGIAHDFNNILMSVMGNISLARQTMTHATGADSLLEAEQACVRARQITWQLLTFSKGGVPVKKPLALRRLLEEAASLALRGTTATCALECPDDLWMVEADDGQLVQVFTNLLINAQQAMPNGGVVQVRAENVFEVTGRSHHALRIESGAYVRVSIADRGIGIAKEHLSRIFDPYFTTKQRGSGLGLATAYSILKNHGGLITVDSQPGRGTSMEVMLPAVAVVERRDVRALVVNAGGGRPRVLVMDDEASVRALAANMLEFLGYDAEIVDSGTAAVERFRRAVGKRRPFDAVILDLVVPGELGARETISQLVGIDPAVRAIVVSGYVQDTAIACYRDFGFAAAMNKPYSLQELRSTLETVIATPTCRIH